MFHLNEFEVRRHSKKCNPVFQKKKKRKIKIKKLFKKNQESKY